MMQAPTVATPPQPRAAPTDQSFSPSMQITSSNSSAVVAMLMTQQQMMESQIKTMRAELTTQEAVTTEQLEALQTRIEAVHAAQLLSEEERFVLEDQLADFLELKASRALITREMSMHLPAVGTVSKLVALSEGMANDAVFARQARRKFV